MSMVKAYHGKNCSELQLCCSTWMAPYKLPGDSLTPDLHMDHDQSWTWRSSPASNNTHPPHPFSPLHPQKHFHLDPPPQFQDNPPINTSHLHKFASAFVSKLIADAVLISCKITWSIPCSQDCHMSDFLAANNPASCNGFRLCWTPELLPHRRLRSVSASHNSLSTIASSNMDDSSYIKSAVSHDVLTTKQISDMYNVPFDSDIYAVPVDMVRGKDSSPSGGGGESEGYARTWRSSQKEGRSRKSRSASASSMEPIHVTVEEVRQYLQALYCNETLQKGCSQDPVEQPKRPFKSLQNNLNPEVRLNTLNTKSAHVFSGKSKKAKENLDTSTGRPPKFKKCRQSFSANLKETLCNIFRIKKLPSPDHCLRKRQLAPRSDQIGMRLSGHDDLNPPSPITKPPFSKRALPPLPNPSSSLSTSYPLPNILSPSTFSPPHPHPPPPPPPTPPPSSPPPITTTEPSVSVDFASSIEKVKDYGWYWGPISGEAAEKILSNEPDGSFIVRDSSDDYYIFSLTFKLNSIIRHVRIEHDKGNFSFGSSTRFKSHTIVDFIESAVEHSRSGRYLFFLHRRPVLGPMRVQLLHPVSRFKQVQSLQHMCRFVILKMVRRDLIPYLPLPRRVLDYLSTHHYYAEDLSGDEQNDSSREDLDQLLPFRQEVFS